MLLVRIIINVSFDYELQRSLSKKSTDEFKVEEKSVDVKKETKKADKKDTQKEEQEKDIKEKVEVPYSPDGNKVIVTANKNIIIIIQNNNFD